MKDKIDPANLVMCDLETGICEVPNTTSERRTSDVAASLIDLSGAKVDESSSKDVSTNADTSAPRLNPQHNESNRTDAE